MSDKLHERLVQRFIDRRTSALMRGLKREVAMPVDVNEDGAVLVDGHVIGKLDGLNFTLDADATGPEEKALKAAAHQAVRPLLAEAIGKVVGAPDADLGLSDDGAILWSGHVLARLLPGQPLLLPKFTLKTADHAADEHRELLTSRLQSWLNAQVDRDLAPLTGLRDAANGAELEGMARGFAYRLHEAGGMMERNSVRADLETLTQDDRRALRKVGVRFGRNTIYLPAMLKPRPTRLRAILNFQSEGRTGLPFIPPVGLTSFDAPDGVSAADFAQAGFKVYAGRAIRIDILDRVADALFDAATAARGPTPMPLMVVSLLGVSNERAETVVEGLGWEKLQVPAPPPSEEPAPEAASEDDTAPIVDGDVAAETPADSDVVLEAAPVEAVSIDAAPVEEPVTEVASAEIPEATEPAEPALITVWRLARAPRRDANARPPRRDGAPRPDRGDRPEGAKRFEGRGPSSGSSSGRGQHPGQNPGEQRDPRGPRKSGGKGSFGKGGKPGDRGHDRGDRQRVFSAGPEAGQKPRTLDPSNPFAALAALKMSASPASKPDGDGGGQG